MLLLKVIKLIRKKNLFLEWKSEGATAVFYPQNIEGEEVPAFKNTKENRKAICKIIQEWNCKKIYNAREANCQKFARDIFKTLGLNEEFSNYKGYVGEFIEYISEYSNSIEEVYPCIIQKGKILVQWKTHEELDNWHKENIESFMDANSLIKSFHRAFQMKGEVNISCPVDAPTLLIGNDGEKLPVHELSGYTSDTKLSGFSNGNSGNSGLSGN